MKISPNVHQHPNTQFTHIQQMAGPDATITLMCLSDRTQADPVCAYALANCSCTPNGTHFVRCALTREQREELKRLDIENVAWK